VYLPTFNPSTSCNVVRTLTGDPSHEDLGGINVFLSAESNLRWLELVNVCIIQIYLRPASSYTNRYQCYFYRCSGGDSSVCDDCSNSSSSSSSSYHFKDEDADSDDKAQDERE